MKDAVTAGHEDVGRVLLAGLGLVPQRDFVAILDDDDLVHGRSHRALQLGDLVVVHVRLRTKEESENTARETSTNRPQTAACVRSDLKLRLTFPEGLASPAGDTVVAAETRDSV